MPSEFSSPAAGFDEPLAMWLECHERVHRFCSLMVRLNHHVEAKGADADAKVTANSIRRYFNEAAPRHHEDEEADLFPPLKRRMPAEKYEELSPVLAAIEQDHVDAAGIWIELDASLARIEAGEKALMNKALLDRWTALYQHHILAEEQVIQPMLKHYLKSEDWIAIGRAMAARRGADWTESPAPAGGAPRQSIVPIKAAKP